MSKLTFTASSLPVSKKLHKLLSEQLTAHLLSSEALTTSRYLVFNFRDKSYSADEGGFHPVEMAICQTSTGEWSIEYITDFAYMGNYYPELERNLDFDFRVGQFFVAYRGCYQCKVAVMPKSCIAYGRVTFLPMLIWTLTTR